MQLSRRRAMQLGLALTGSSCLSACGNGLVPQPRPAEIADSPVDAAHAIDVHAHVFNAADIPIKGFLQQSFLSASQRQARRLQRGLSEWSVRFAGDRDTASRLMSRLAIRLAPAIRDLAHGLSPSAVDEATRTALFENHADAERYYRDNPTPSDLLERGLVELLYRLYRADYPDPPILDDVDFDLTALAEAKVTALLDIAASTVFNERAPSRDPGAIKRIVRRLFADPELTQGAVGWAAGVIRSRFENMVELTRIYAGRPDNPGVRFFVPLMLDMGFWFGDHAARGSDMDAQTHLAQRLQDLWNAAPRGPLFHGFVGFDPVRNIVDDGLSLGRVKRAIAEQGFIGVKLYPVLGFAPTGNSDDALNYPISVRQALRGKLAPGQGIGQAIDASLSALYDWADGAGVPLLAHANASYSSNGKERYLARAHPANWRRVLDTYRHLRLCLAHFGDFNMSGRDQCRALSGPVASDPVRKCRQAWEHDTISMLLDPRLNGRVFADLSYHSQAIDHGQGRDAASRDRAEFETGWALVRNRIEELAPGLLYGSDWFLLGREEGHEKYIHHIDAFMRDKGGLGSPALRRKFYRDNALRYLGLSPGVTGPGGATRRRLQACYRKNGLNIQRLDDALAPPPEPATNRFADRAGKER